MHKERIIEVNGQPHCWCSGHKEYHLCQEFQPSQRTSNGMNYRCRKWERDDRYARKLRRNVMTPIAAHEVQYEIDGAQELLAAMGYDLAKPIYQQFLERNQHRL